MPSYIVFLKQYVENSNNRSSHGKNLWIMKEKSVGFVYFFLNSVDESSE